MLVSLGRNFDVDEDLLLAEPGPPIEDLQLRAVVDEAAKEGWGEQFHATGSWRILRDQGDRVDIGAWSHVGDGWVTMRVERSAGTWQVTGSSYGQQVGPSRAQRASGLTLIWPAPRLRVRRGQVWDLCLALRNDRTEPVRDMTSPYCTGHLEQDGEVLPAEEYMAFTMDGLDLDLAPGEAVELPVALRTRRPERLPVGLYVLKAGSIDLELEAPPVPLEIH